MLAEGALARRLVLYSLIRLRFATNRILLFSFSCMGDASFKPCISIIPIVLLAKAAF